MRDQHSMIQPSPSEGDISREILTLLELRPAEVKVRKLAVLTTAREVWSRHAGDSRIHIVDLSDTLGVRSVGNGSTPADNAGNAPSQRSQALAAALLDYGPDSVIVDFTIPFELTLPAQSVLHDPMSPLAGMAPGDNVDLPRDRVEVRHILLAWAATLPSVNAISAVTSSSLTMDPSADWLRQYLSTRLNLCAVIELPTDIFRPLTSGGTSALFFGGNRRDVYFDSLTSRGDLVDIEARPWFKNLSAWMDKAPAGVIHLPDTSGRLLRSTAVMEETSEAEGRESMEGPSPDPLQLVGESDKLAKEAAPVYAASPGPRPAWSPNTSDPGIVQTYQRVQRLGKVVALGELAQIVAGVARPRSVEDSEDGVPLVEPRTLKDGTFDVDNAIRVHDQNVSDEAHVRVGDILLTQNLADRFSVSLNRYNGPAILSQGVIAIRLTDDRVTPDYLLEYLSSSTARKLLSAESSEDPGTGRQSLSLSQIRHFPVPLVDPEQVQGLTSIQRIEGVLRDKADELQSLRRSLFDAGNSREFRNHLDQLRRRGKLLSISMQSLESLDYQVAVTYPYPLAYGYRLLQSAGDPRDLYREQFNMTENMLAFLASLSLVLLTSDDRQDIGIDSQRGMTIGKWRDIVILCSQRFATYNDVPLAHALNRLNIGVKNKGFGGDIEQLVQARNAWAHMKDPSRLQELVDATDEQRERLRRCMEALDFLTEFPIRQIEQVNRTRSGEWRLECACYRGDHPALPQELVRTHNDLPVGELTRDLFLDIGEGHWVSLAPFITVWDCPECRWRETYYIDSWNAEKGTVEIKSFERGHTQARPELRKVLHEWANGSEDD